LNTADIITQEGDKITFSSSAERVYYEGKLTKIELPWNISIRYFIDGREYPAAEVAGKSGKLEIRFSVTKNEKHTGNFFESYALQASFTLNTQKCKNISAPNATVANVGKNKQISYTVLPGKGIDATITADVTEFEMSSVAINGVPLSLDMEIDDGELIDKIGEIQDAASEANDGAGELCDGLDELVGNNQDLLDGANELKDGLRELDENSSSLTDGVDALKSGLGELTGSNRTLVGGAWQAYAGLCEAAQSLVNSRLAAFGSAEITLAPDTYQGVLAELIAQLDETAIRTQATENALAAVTAEAEANADALYLGYLRSGEDEIYARYIISIENEIYAQYVQSNADDIYYAFVKEQNDANDDILYKNFAYEYVVRQAAESGMTEAEATAFAASEQGQAQIALVYANLTNDDRSAIILAAVDELTYRQMKDILSGALSGLTEAQKREILAGATEALTSSQKQEILSGAALQLTEEQKAQIREGYIGQMVQSEEVTAQIEAAVAQATAAKAEIADLKTRLDEFGALYRGIVAYTGGVSQAYGGADKLAEGISDYTDGVSQALAGAGELSDGISDYTDGVSTAADGAKELKDGLQEFYEQTIDMDTEISDKIQELIDEMTGSGYELNSFVSEKNADVSSVQFVIQTEAIEIPDPPAPEQPQEEKLTFRDKFLKLFGID
ncbi:MAG: hypothetical protein ACI4U2_01040, partial [Christensenellaceae bacterium]